MAKNALGQTPSEFGGRPGLYGDASFRQGAITGVLTPAQERMALMQTNESLTDDAPAYGAGGVKVQ